MHSNKLSKTLRKNSTDHEKKLWRHLRNNNFHELKFRRQYPFGNYILDFVCLEKNIIIKLDGSQHNIGENPAKDHTRDNYLKLHDFKILRFWNNEINENLDGVLETIGRECGVL